MASSLARAALPAALPLAPPAPTEAGRCAATLLASAPLIDAADGEAAPANGAAADDTDIEEAVEDPLNAASEASASAEEAEEDVAAAPEAAADVEGAGVVAAAAAAAAAAARYASACADGCCGAGASKSSTVGTRLLRAEAEPTVATDERFEALPPLTPAFDASEVTLGRGLLADEGAAGFLWGVTLSDDFLFVGTPALLGVGFPFFMRETTARRPRTEG
jgi:hypothetical protein